MSVEHTVEWKLAGGMAVPGENPPQYYFDHHKFHMTYLGSSPGGSGEKQSTNRLRYDKG
jgi:hypothetical protein